MIDVEYTTYRLSVSSNYSSNYSSNQYLELVKKLS